MQGHGIFKRHDGALVSSVAGVIQRDGQLVTSSALHSRYPGREGDMVVGRVVGVGSGRWLVDIGSRQHAVLHIGSVVLPGGTQRRRTAEDALQMRTLFREGDLISAEVNEVRQDGCVLLHTRSLKYGKLANGQVEVVPASLVPRRARHVVSLPCQVDAIVGCNGWVWLTETPPEAERIESGVRGEMLAEEVERRQRLHAARVVGPRTRAAIARLAAAARLLTMWGASVTPESLMAVFRAVEADGVPVKRMLHPDVAVRLREVVIAPEPAGGMDEEDDDEEGEGGG